ncbi:MAG: DUF89 family protein [Vicinamibacteria bacterium]|nr:DUF89 family protein [Vicinamibacteria bacterium]
MKTYLDCIPCFVRQALEAVRPLTTDVAVHERIVREVLRSAAEMDFAQSPPSMGQFIHRRLREITGVADPYRDKKISFNRMALEMLAENKARVEAASDPLGTAVRLAVAGNVIDLGVKGGLTESDAREAIERALSEPLHGDVNELRRALSSARRILYLTDNAGEIVFDRLLIEQLPLDRVTVAVRGRPIINDATLEDAVAAGLDSLVEVIDNGSDAPGTILSDCSEGFRERFRTSDLIIAKGQGNFETLYDDGNDVMFLFKAKCPVIAAHIDLPLGSHVMTRPPKAARDARCL